MIIYIHLPLMLNIGHPYSHTYWLNTGKDEVGHFGTLLLSSSGLRFKMGSIARLVFFLWLLLFFWIPYSSRPLVKLAVIIQGNWCLTSGALGMSFLWIWKNCDLFYFLHTWCLHFYSKLIEWEFQIEDARAAMLLYQKNRKQWEKVVKDSIRLQKKQKQRKHRKKPRGGSDENNVAVAS